MKIRGIAIVEFDSPGGYKEAAELQFKLEDHIRAFVEADSRAVYHNVTMRRSRPGWRDPK